MTILAIGGTGRVGSAVVQRLVEEGVSVRVLSRNADKLAKLPAGAEGVLGDLDKPETLGPVFDGVTAMLLSLTVDPHEQARGLTAVEAAARAGVTKVVHISVKMYEGSDSRVFYQAKQAIEKRIRELGLTLTTIRPANFFQSDSTLKTYLVDQGVFPPPIGSRGVDRLDARDVGYAAAGALLSSDYDNQDIDLYGPETYTGETVAAVYQDALGQDVRYPGDDIAAWAELNSPRLGAWYINALSGLYEQQQRHGMMRPQGEPQHPLLPATLRTLPDYAREMASLWRG